MIPPMRYDSAIVANNSIYFCLKFLAATLQANNYVVIRLKFLAAAIQANNSVIICLKFLAAAIQANNSIYFCLHFLAATIQANNLHGYPVCELYIYTATLSALFINTKFTRLPCLLKLS